MLTYVFSELREVFVSVACLVTLGFKRVSVVLECLWLESFALMSGAYA